MAFQPAFGHLFTGYPVIMVFMAAILPFELDPSSAPPPEAPLP